MNRKPLAASHANGSVPIRVLMADPDASLFPCYREPLWRDGFELATASSGLECVARLRSAHRTCWCSSRSCRGVEAREFWR